MAKITAANEKYYADLLRTQIGLAEVHGKKAELKGVALELKIEIEDLQMLCLEVFIGRKPDDYEVDRQGFPKFIWRICVKDLKPRD
jgi:hypothetical protein